jgi:hypothetical protein
LFIQLGGIVGSFDPDAEVAEHGAWLRPHLLNYSFGYSRSTHWRAIDQADAQTISRLVFSGTWDAERERVVAAVARTFAVDVLGPYWHRSKKHPGVEVLSHTAVFGQAQASLISRYAVTLNIPRAQNLRSGNMRTFETPAQGGMQGNPYGERVLLNGIWATRLDDFAHQIEAWLLTPRTQRLKLLRLAQAEVQPFSYSRRLHDILEALLARNA